MFGRQEIGSKVPSFLKSTIVCCVALSIATCGGSDSGTGPPAGNDDPVVGLRAGLYRVTFNIPLSNSTPGGLIGDHEFLFGVVDPTTERTSFDLISSTHIGRTLGGDLTAPVTSYLSDDSRKVVTNGLEWLVAWDLINGSVLAVEVTMTDNGAGSFTFAGCRGSRTSVILGDGTYPGILCNVVRAD